MLKQEQIVDVVDFMLQEDLILQVIFIVKGIKTIV